MCPGKASALSKPPKATFAFALYKNEVFGDNDKAKEKAVPA